MSHRALIAAAAAVMATIAAQPALAEGAAPDELLARYQPALVLDRTERFAPVAVDGFVDGSELLRLGPAGTFEPVEPSPAGLPVHGDGWRLDRDNCTPSAGLAAVGCYASQVSAPTRIYGRHHVNGGSVVLQYWFFYEYNFWSLQYPATNLVWQAHEGEWEVVTVVLDERRRPVEAAYGQHCGGERRTWSGVEKVPGTDHPVVYVGAGSHASLFAPGLHAISLDCYPAEAVAFFRAFGVTPFDVVVPGRVLRPETTPLERIHEYSPRWVRFPGTWGEAQFVGAPPPVGIVEFGTGPVGPAFHDVWIDPLGTIAGYPLS